MAEYAACEIVMGVIGGVAVVLSVVLIVAYRSYKYEQELDSLLWKIDPIELKVNDSLLIYIYIYICRNFLMMITNSYYISFVQISEHDAESSIVTNSKYSIAQGYSFRKSQVRMIINFFCF